MVEDLEMECPTKLLNPLKRKEAFGFQAGGRENHKGEN